MGVVKQVELQNNPTAGAQPRPTEEAPARTLWFVAVRALWIALAILVLAIALAAIPMGFRLMQSLCIGSDCPGGQLGAEDAHVLNALGLSISAYAWIETVWAVIILLALLVVAAVVFWRQPRNNVAILTSFFLLAFFPTFYDGMMRALVRAELVWFWPVILIETLGAWFALVLPFLFPNGRFVPVRSNVMVLPITAYGLMLLLLTPMVQASNNPFSAVNILQFAFRGLLLIGLIAQVYRYRHFSNSIERQQTKWVLFGMAFFVLQDVMAPLWPVIFPPLGQRGIDHSLYILTVPTVAKTFLLLFIFSVAISIQRYRLWEIDLLINRTLVYVPLTAILAGLFAAMITLSQRTFLALTGQTSDAASAITTLAVVAAFTPVKDRLQTTVDKKFKYRNDPARKLSAFQDELRTRAYAIDPVRVTRRLAEEAMDAFNAKGGAVFQTNEKQPAYTCGEWEGEIRLSAVIETRKHKYGTAALTARRNKQAYDELDCAALEQAASFIAQIIEEDNSRPP